MRKILIFAAFISMVACSAEDSVVRDLNNSIPGEPGDSDDGDPNSRSIEGIVFVPNNGPGMVPPGHELPVNDAVVYLSETRPAPIERGAQCLECTVSPAGGTETDHSGYFELRNVNPGEYWLVIEKGQFRSEQTLTITESSPRRIEMDGAKTTLPSEYDPEAGKTIPRIALAGAFWDPIESILGKMGIGEVDSSGDFIQESADGVFDLYANGSGDLDESGMETLADLVTDLERMLEYQIIFIGCSQESNTGALDDEQVLRNIRSYVEAGGKIYATDYSGEWVDNVWPGQMILGGESGNSTNIDTPPEAYDAESDSWNPSLFGNSNGSGSTTVPSTVRNADLQEWMNGQTGPLSGASIGPLNPFAFQVTGSFTRILGLNSVELGVDAETGDTIVDTPQKYVVGQSTDAGEAPMTVTFEPAGCGRVLYSSYHTAEDPHIGLYEQERILVYLIMELGVCKDDVIIE